jgi:group II intron reverse transcriptase/maturase
MLDDQIGGHKTSWVLDADIRGFFDNIDHEWMMKFVEAKIKDPRVLRLVKVMLKAGVVKDMEGYEPTEQGSGQGSVCSPILANIYMHYVLLWWFHEVITPQLMGYAGIINYADDFVICFQYKREAEMVYERLKHRMAYFGLSLAEEKCRLIEFGRFARLNRKQRGEGKPETFDFLGFTHICSTTKNGKFKVRRETSRKKFIKKCKDMHRKIGSMRTEKTEDIVRWINQVLIGYYHYYGVFGNYNKVIEFRWNVLKSLFYWLNRRSQKRSYTKSAFFDMITHGHPVVRPKTFYVYI